MTEEIQNTKFEKIVLWTATKIYSPDMWKSMSALDSILQSVQYDDVDIIDFQVEGEYKLVKIEEEKPTDGGSKDE